MTWNQRAVQLGRALGPSMGPIPAAQALMAAFGGGLVILAMVAVNLASGGFTPMALPLAASAVLVFAAPNSPLAQPWPVFTGNVVSALIGGALGFGLRFWLGMDLAGLLAPGLAFFVAIAVMARLRALHPPGGAMAVMAALMAVVGNDWLNWVLWPVAVESAGLVLCATLWARLTGRVYPFRQPPAQPGRAGLDPQQLRDLLARFRQGANIGVADLGRILTAAESEAAARRFGGLTVGDVMTPNPVTVGPRTGLAELARLFARHGHTALPVTEEGRYLGLVTQNALIARVAAADRRSGDVAAIMDGQAPILEAAAPVARLLAVLSDGGAPAAPVLRDGALVGIVSRSDLLALLAHELAQGAGDPR